MESAFDSLCYSVIFIHVTGTSLVCYSVSFAILVKDTDSDISSFYEKT